MATADFLDEKRNEIGARLKELKPLVDEYQRLEAAAAALDGIDGNASNGSAARRVVRGEQAGSKARATRKRGATHGRRGRPKGSGTRGAEALALVTASPGITIPELAEKMGIKQNYLYRVLPGLAEDGLVVKDGRGWKPKATGATPGA
jgi:sugar-specific transcriptional regulator TrmB